MFTSKTKIIAAIFSICFASTIASAINDKNESDAAHERYKEKNPDKIDQDSQDSTEEKA